MSLANAALPAFPNALLPIGTIKRPILFTPQTPLIQTSPQTSYSQNDPFSNHHSLAAPPDAAVLSLCPMNTLKDVRTK